MEEFRFLTFAAMPWLGYFFTRLLIESFRFLPFWGLYRLSDALAFVLCRVVGYRREVVWDNLRRSFPEKSEAELAVLVRKSYLNLTDITLEAMKSHTLPVQEIQRRCPPLNPELINPYLDRGQSIILSGSHYNNWEYSGITIPPGFHGITIGSYKPLSNKLLDRYINQARSRTGLTLVDMESTFLTIRKRERENQTSIYFLMSDQSPSSRKSAHWVQFLGQKTASLPGVDVLARKFDFPVFYYHVQRLRRGFYEITYSEINLHPAEAEPTSISQAFADKLETIIRQQPENWLWSHKRWKMKPFE